MGLLHHFVCILYIEDLCAYFQGTTLPCLIQQKNIDVQSICLIIISLDKAVCVGRTHFDLEAIAAVINTTINSTNFYMS